VWSSLASKPTTYSAQTSSIMVAAVNPPFRADHIGSLKRPVELLQLREQFDKGEVSKEELTKLEDKVIKEEVEQLKQIGIKAVTDGEFRRSDIFLVATQ
jgi:methionine synthase II (cobalamin-independent)